MDIRFWLSMHPRNFDCDKVIRLWLFVSPYVCLFMLADVKCQTYYTICVSLLLDLLWSIDSCQNSESAEKCHVTVW